LSLFQKLHRLLDRRLAINPVHVIQVDRVQSQPLKTLFQSLLCVLGGRVHGHRLPVELTGELGSEEDLRSGGRVVLEVFA
jgi:hypothetical protein